MRAGLSIGVLTLTVITATGCYGPYYAMQNAQRQALVLHQQNQVLVSERDEAREGIQLLAGDNDRLLNEIAGLHSRIELSETRLANIKNERAQLHERYISLLNAQKSLGSPLSSESTRRFQELANRYPEFDFDPETGVSRFHGDILFASGSDQLRTSAMPVLRDFARIVNQGDTRGMKILVVGHTDNKQIIQHKTLSKHPTNWHLSTNRANSVVMELASSGVEPARLGAAGYSEHQPTASNANTEGRQKNRRVEIFVFAPDAVVAAWDPTVLR